MSAIQAAMDHVNVSMIRDSQWKAELFSLMRRAMASEDDRFRLIFTCCHLALPPEGQVALTLREICGLTTEEIARAFLVTPATLAQRIVRAKAVIRDRAIPYQVPVSQECIGPVGSCPPRRVPDFQRRVFG